MKKTFVALVAAAGLVAAVGSAQAAGSGCIKNNTSASNQGTTPQPSDAQSGRAG